MNTVVCDFFCCCSVAISSPRSRAVFVERWKPSWRFRRGCQLPNMSFRGLFFYTALLYPRGEEAFKCSKFLVPACWQWVKKIKVVVTKVKQIISLFVLLTWHKAWRKAASLGAPLKTWWCVPLWVKYKLCPWCHIHRMFGSWGCWQLTPWARLCLWLCCRCLCSSVAGKFTVSFSKE